MPNAFGQRLKHFRKKAGLTQEELGYRLDVSYMTVRRWEADRIFPRVDEIKKIAQALSVPEFDLLNDNGTQSSGWVLSIKVAQHLQEEVIDLSKGVPSIATIATSKEGGLLTLGGNYEIWTDDNAFKTLIADLKKLRSTVIQNGIALGSIKQ